MTTENSIKRIKDALRKTDSATRSFLERLWQDYIKNDEMWMCPTNAVSNTSHLISTESLLCFMIPFGRKVDEEKLMAFDSDKCEFWPEIVKPDMIKAAVEKHIKTFDTEDAKVFSGRPYIKKQGNTEPVDIQHIDSHCMLISLIVLYEKCFGEPQHIDLRNLMIRLVSNSLTFINDSAIKSEQETYLGFFITNLGKPDRPYKYSTWMAIETLIDLPSETQSTELPFFITTEVTDIVNTLRETVMSNVKSNYIRLYVDCNFTDKEAEHFGERNMTVHNDLVVEDEGDSAIQYNVWILLTLLHLNYSSADIVTKALNMLEAKEKKIVKQKLEHTKTETLYEYLESKPVTSEATVGLNGESQDIVEKVMLEMTDKSALPQFLKVMCLAISKFPSLKNSSQLEKLEELIDRIMKSQSLINIDEDEKARIGWHSEDSSKYSVYICERVIEALTSFARLVGQLEQSTQSSNEGRGNIKQSLITREIANEIAKSAVVIQISGKSAEQVIKREVAAAVKGVEDRINKEIENRISSYVQENLPSMIECYNNKNSLNKSSRNYGKLSREIRVLAKDAVVSNKTEDDSS